MFYHLPPAGNRIIWEPTSVPLQKLKERFSPFNVFFYGSGAQSLAVAIKSSIKNRNIDKPEVLLSAYSCPELVSAILYAGARPVLVDLERQKPWIQLSDLESKITKNTAAVIVVNLFGLPERLDKINEICKVHNLSLIEDCAQSFPDVTDDRFWKGDFIILSFGRGKPVSTLGGGALLCRNSDLMQGLLEESNAIQKSSNLELAKYKLKIYLYNLLLQPRLYFIPNSLPFLKLGETKFKPMHEIEPISENNLSILDANIEKYISSKTDETQHWLSEIIAKSEYTDLAKACLEVNKQTTLLRYPILAQTRIQRDELYLKLNKAGLGASKMYQRPLNEIQGLEEMFMAQGQFPNAREFAESLLTLPTHAGLKMKDIQALKKILL
ncbi:MAG: DegT/DnrJ/EryC1/StrS family aminotransferase [Gammaproteobacteria bacterium]|nr:DegT/DnrJ/EryC1/StrS family aminotransferase [Gammaproteobacteria bacterium]